MPEDLQKQIGKLKRDGGQAFFAAANQPDVAADSVKAFFLADTACWLECPDAAAKRRMMTEPSGTRPACHPDIIRAAAPDAGE